MMIHEPILIVGGGISGLSTALGLHRLGIRSLVLESSDRLRITGFALTMWTNAWRALDALGIGEYLRTKSVQIHGFQVFSPDSSLTSSDRSPEADVNFGNSESRCVKRKDLLETLEKELPKGTIRYSSKVVSIEESGNFKLVHLADGSVVKTTVLIGCDGVNSMVAKWLGLQDPNDGGRSAIRGFSVYWFCTLTPSIFNYDEKEQNPFKMKQFVLSNIENAPQQVYDIVERTELDCISYAPLKYRSPWNILLGHIVKNNVCVAGDALHPMTPDLGQGGCSALEDSIVLARCLAEAVSVKRSGNEKESDGEYVKMERGLQNYAKERRWRSYSLISMSYIVGMIQESNGKVMRFLRKSFLSKCSVWIVVRMADFDCGKLLISE
ncbi:FAD/NAD(P)-binding oxidoreductase family protein [Abeliophyllum distichum]|uniref:FAD/NAD(P)-binding oxidoreductase family protein n=1 Tax=Abeliophyllum distichum TaxID=126358 RepID=A0ABD1SVF1_9LAMI